MKPGDLIVVPHKESQFYVAEIRGATVYHADKVNEDTGYRRPVKWLNQKKPLHRGLAPSALQSRMKYRRTCADASDLLEQIVDALDFASRGEQPGFHKELRSKLIELALNEIRHGRMNPDNFEILVRDLLLALGFHDVHIRSKRDDKGADVLGSFSIGGTMNLLLAVQAKHYQEKPPVQPQVVEQLRNGMKAERKKT